MEICYDVDAALSEVPVNIFPLTDDTDFKTRETAVPYNATGMDLVWNFVTTAGAFTQTAVTPTSGGAYDWTHQGDGMYTIEIPASGGASINNDSEGFGWFTGVCTGVLPWRSPIFCFRAAGINDKLIDDAYSVTRGLAGTALPAAAADTAGGLPVSDAGGLDIDTLLGRLDAAISSRSELTAQQVWEYTTRTLSAFGFNVTVGTNNDKTGYTLTATPPTASDISTAVWGAGTRTLTSFGSLVSDIVSGVWGAGTRTLTSFGTLVADIWSYATRALTDKAGFTIGGTKQTLDSLNDVSSATVRTQVDAALTAYDAPTKTELDSAVSPLATSAALSAVAGYVDTEVAAILAMLQHATYGLSALLAAVNTRMASDDYTAPANTSIGTILSAVQHATYGLSALQTAIAAIPTVNGDFPRGVAINNLVFKMVSTSDHVTGVPDLAVTGTIRKDGGEFAALTGTITSIGGGLYNLSTVTSAEMTAGTVTLRFAAAGADDTVMVIKTS